MANSTSRVVKQIMLQVMGDTSNLEASTTRAKAAIENAQRAIQQSTANHVAKQKKQLESIEAMEEAQKGRAKERLDAENKRNLTLSRINEQELRRKAQLAKAEETLRAATLKRIEAEKQANRTAQSGRDRVRVATSDLRRINTEKQKLLLEPVIDQGALKKALMDLSKATRDFTRADANQLTNEAEIKRLEKKAQALKHIANNEKDYQRAIALSKDRKGNDLSEAKRLEMLDKLDKKVKEYHRTVERLNTTEIQAKKLDAEATHQLNVLVNAEQTHDKLLDEIARSTKMTNAEKQKAIEGSTRWLQLLKQEATAQASLNAGLRTRSAAYDKLRASLANIARQQTQANTSVKSAAAGEQTAIIATKKAWEDYNNTINKIDKSEKKTAQSIDNTRIAMANETNALINANKRRQDSISNYEKQLDKLAKKINSMSGRFGEQFLAGLKKQLNMKFDLGQLFSADGLSKGIAQAVGALVGIFTGKAILGGLDLLGNAVKNLIIAPFKIASFAISNFFKIGQMGFRQVGSWVSQAVALNREMLQFSVQTGMSVQQAQKFLGIFRAFGLDVYWISMSIGTLRKEIAANNKVFTGLGVATRDAAGNIRDVADVIEDTRIAFQNLNDQEQQNWLADFASAIPFGSMILPAIIVDPEIKETLRALNVEMSELDQHDLNRVTASFQAASLASQGLAKTVSSALAPAIEDIANAVIRLTVQATPYIYKFFRSISDGVHDVLSTVGLLTGSNIIGEFTKMFERSGDIMGGGGAGYDSFVDQISDADRGIRDLDDAIESLSDTMSDQQDVIADLRDAMQDEIEVLNDAKEAVRDTLDVDLKPIEDQIDLLDDLKDSWEDLRDIELGGLEDNIDELEKANKAIAKAAKLITDPLEDANYDLKLEKDQAIKDRDAELDPIQDSIDAIEGANDDIDRATRDFVQPLEDRIWDLNEQKKAVQDQQDIDLAMLGAKPTTKGVGDGYQQEIDDIEDEIDAIQDLGDAYEREQNKIIRARQKETKALDDQIKAINKATEIFKRAKDEEKRILQETIAAKQAEGQENERLARMQEYYDKRAYLMGETLIAQQERRLAFLNDRQSRQRSAGESDIDYQLRIQQLNTTNDIGGLKNQEEITDLDKAHAIALENDAREDAIQLIQDQIDLIDKAIETRTENDENQIAIMEARKEDIQLELDAIEEAMYIRKEADDQTIRDLQTRKEGLEELRDIEIEAAQKAVDAWEAAKEAIDAAAEAEVDRLDKLIDADQRSIDLRERADDRRKQANDDEIDRLQRQLDAREEYWDNEIEGIQSQIDANDFIIDQTNRKAAKDKEINQALIDDYKEQLDNRKEFWKNEIDGVQDQIDANKELATDLKDAADVQLEALDDQMEAVRDLYDAQIEGAEDVLDLYEDQLEALQDQQKALQKVKTENEELLASAKDLGDPFAEFREGLGKVSNQISGPDSIGRKIGKWIKETFVYPFMSKKDQQFDRAKTAYEDGNIGKAGPFLPFEETEAGKGFQTATGNPEWEKTPTIGEGVSTLLSGALDSILETWDQDIKPRVEKIVAKLISSIISGVSKYIDDKTSDPDFWWNTFKVAMWFAEWPRKMSTEIPKEIIENLISGIGKFIFQNKPEMQKEWDKFWGEVLAAGYKLLNPVALVAELVKWIVEGIKKFIDEHEKLMDNWEEFWEEALTAGAKIFAKLPEKLIEWIVSPFKSFIAEQTPEFFNSGWDLFTGFMDGSWDVIKGLPQWFTDNIWTPFYNFITQTTPRMFTEGWNLFTSFISGAWDVIKGLSQWLTDNIWTPITTKFTELSEKALQNGGDIANSLISGLWGVFSTIGSWLDENVVNPIANKFGELINKIGSAFGGLWGKIEEPLKFAYDGFAAFYNEAARMIEALADFVGLSVDLPQLGPWASVAPGGGGGYIPSVYGGYALGGVVPGQGGQKNVHVTEEGFDEYIISTNPVHKQRSLGLVGDLLGKLGDKGSDFGPNLGKGGWPDISLPSIGADIISGAGSAIKGAWNAGGNLAGAIAGAPQELFGMAKDGAMKVMESALKKLMASMMSIFNDNMLGQLMAGAASKLATGALGWFSGAHDKNKAETSVGGQYAGGGTLENIIRAGGFYPSQGFGWTPFAADGGYGGEGHRGVDFHTAQVENRPLLAPDEAVVNYKSEGGYGGGFGTWMQLDLVNKGFNVILAHLNKIVVSLGERITDMDKIIAYSGNTGYSTGPHVHIETRDYNGVPFNPSSMFPSYGFANGGLLRPKTKLYDPNRSEFYGQAAEYGPEYVSPLAALNPAKADPIIPRLLQSAINNSTTNKPTYSLSIGEINANTKADGEAIGQAIQDKFFQMFDELPIHAPAVRANRRS